METAELTEQGQVVEWPTADFRSASFDSWLNQEFTKLLGGTHPMPTCDEQHHRRFLGKVQSKELGLRMYRITLYKESQSGELEQSLKDKIFSQGGGLYKDKERRFMSIEPLEAPFKRPYKFTPGLRRPRKVKKDKKDKKDGTDGTAGTAGSSNSPDTNEDVQSTTPLLQPTPPEQEQQEQQQEQQQQQQQQPWRPVLPQLQPPCRDPPQTTVQVEEDDDDDFAWARRMSARLRSLSRFLGQAVGHEQGDGADNSNEAKDTAPEKEAPPVFREPSMVDFFKWQSCCGIHPRPQTPAGITEGQVRGHPWYWVF